MTPLQFFIFCWTLAAIGLAALIGFTVDFSKRNSSNNYLGRWREFGTLKALSEMDPGCDCLRCGGSLEVFGAWREDRGLCRGCGRRLEALAKEFDQEEGMI